MTVDLNRGVFTDSGGGGVGERLGNLSFYVAFETPYVQIPTVVEQSTYWVNYPNPVFQADQGRLSYASHMHQAVHADRLGFDGVMFLEHQATPACLTPVATVMAAALVPQTKRVRIAVCCNPAGLDHPLRLAESLAMLDVMSDGRLDVVATLGTAQSYWASGMRPAIARARFEEALDVMLQAWREPGPTSFAGEHYSHRWLNIWPRPKQNPPPMTILDLGSPASSAVAAQRGWDFCPRFSTIEEQDAAFERYDAAFETETSTQRMLSVLAYVADTDEQAWAEAECHLDTHYGVNWRVDERFTSAPGYMTAEEFEEMLTSRSVSAEAHQAGVAKPRYRIAIGSAETVTELLGKWCQSTKSSRVLFQPQFGDMPEQKAMKNMTLFAEKVIPSLRAAICDTSVVGAEGK